MKPLIALYELMIMAVVAVPAIPAFTKYGWKAFGLFFGEIE